ncbi:hypothetical protein MWMV17_MWMV17_02264 [Acinetobacter calcoaceticus]|uniref:DUF192 domain-containing protein n=2 Tax=Acinetobacter calcoaceticus TaxID=471 RepID=A0ABN0K867_ACICA|nr:hypothetical protein F936_02798 [Acinetobacter calcoaceticus DSM 30006 = CIP 81.8]CAI3142691.1 hypothetical protein MWMV17_MWMV17_02264 [Acinetobacter calcoaceticus]SUU53051.1 Uncharacterized ACR, COG1430 [Acinetobacter calcoaceticus]
MYLNNSNIKFEVFIATSFFSRAAGLLFRKKLKENQCLLISPCTSIHTIGMRYNIDIVFIDAFGYVTDIYYDVKPFKVVSGSSQACSVVEFLGGTLKNYTYIIRVNEQMFFKKKAIL